MCLYFTVLFCLTPDNIICIIQLPAKVIKVDDPANHDAVKTVHQSLLQDDKAIHDHNPETSMSVDEPNNLALPETFLDATIQR